jgi:hypothetical protein
MSKEEKKSEKKDSEVSEEGKLASKTKEELIDIILSLQKKNLSKKWSISFN